MQLSTRELATVLAALRLWQDQTNEADRPNYEHFSPPEREEA